MNATYLDFFGLYDDPFRLTPDPAYYYPSHEHANALLSLDYTLNNREGFCLLTGEPGTGKTTLVRIFINKWQDQAEIALIMTPRLSPEEFLQAILDDLGVIFPLSGNKNDMIKEFRDFLLKHAENGRRVVIVVDEAQQLPDATLEELRLLSNLETTKEKLVQIILVGQPELADKMEQDQFRQLNQRISVRAALSPLAERATADYLATRLMKAGGQTATFFDKAALDTIFRLSCGIPRLINLIASRALMAAYLEGKPGVQERQVVIAAAEVMRKERKAPNTSLKKQLLWGAIIGLVVIAAVLSVFKIRL
ncbi:MAG: AAA family ATPase [Trichlorobacter sp.]|uniref:ExeA family protein n=1 Tax=Trichlorobacter sp. TaxID=2911007 RepID=UPI00255EAF6B|nr:AAA family ATPase [Trichlorobacter sp.]MDK9719123.1 AAA family ATPase [Trichlorobacter sp.]